MSLINREALYKKACDLEAQALAHVGKIANGETKIEEWKIWSAILAERTAFKHDIFDAPSVQPEVLACGSGELNVQSEPHWIQCSERLPEVGAFVLVSKKAFPPNVCMAHRSRDPRSGKEAWNDMLFGKLDDDRVLAWMPLPEPFREEGENE